MANVGDNFTPNQSPEANFTSDAVSGRVSISLDYFDQAMEGFFTRLQDKLSQAGLPTIDFFDSGSSQNGQSGGDAQTGTGGLAGGPRDFSGEQTNYAPDDYDYELDGEEGNENSDPFGERPPYNKKEYGGDLISQNKDRFDFNDDGIAQRNEVRAYRNTLAKGSFQRSSVNSVLEDFKAVKRLFNDQPGEDNGLSDTDLARLDENIQQRGKLKGYPSDYA